MPRRPALHRVLGRGLGEDEAGDRQLARAPRRDRRAAGKENEAAPAPAAAAAPPPAPPFDLEAELEAVVGLAGAKDALRSLRNRLVVGKKRAALGVVDAPPRLYLLVGGSVSRLAREAESQKPPASGW